MRPLLAWLGRLGLARDDPPPAPGPLDALMGRYRHWMVTDRQLAARTIRRYEQGARLFLRSQARQGGNPAGVEGLSEQAVSAFLLAEASRGLSAKSLQGRVAELRSLLRFLYLQAMITTPLGEGVPPVPGWKDTAVPRRLAATEVQALLASCDRATASGKRDLAILLLLARMGLRAAEVAGLELDDFEWRAGELVVRGKAGHRDRMPLLAEVGEAVAAYLLQARPGAGSRAAFLTLRPPPRPMGHTTVSQVVWRQCRIAGVEPVRAHRLRHALATELLSRGVRLPEIAQVLRQRDLATTAVYAKVDYSALRELALPWLVA
jgi:site-specific recombinase XerD